MSAAASSELPVWARVGERRRAHIERVTALMLRWAGEMAVDDATAAAWRDAGRWHDALRDASEEELRALVPQCGWPTELLHGPAAAARLASAGETRTGVLEAIRWHTIGHPGWDHTGRALYMADFLEPGRRFMRADRALLAGLVPRDFDGVFRHVVRLRLEWAVREGHEVHHETVALWNLVR